MALFEGLSEKLKNVVKVTSVGGNVVKISIDGKTAQVSSQIAAKLIQADKALFNATGTHLQINQSYRTNEEQAKLFTELSAKGARVAPPGKSFHEKGLAVDVTNWQQAQPYLNSVGLLNELADDKGHFSFGEFGNGSSVSPANAKLSAGLAGLSERLKSTLATVNSKTQANSETQFNITPESLKRADEIFGTQTPIGTTSGISTQANTAPKAMVFNVGEGLSNVTNVLPGPRISTLEAIKRGEEVQTVPLTPEGKPTMPLTTSQVTGAKSAVGIDIFRTGEAPTYDSLQQLGTSISTAIEKFTDPNKNLASKLLGSGAGVATQLFGNVIGGTIGAAGNIITSVGSEGLKAYQTPEGRQRFWDDVIRTAKETGEFGREIGTEGGQIGSLFGPLAAATSLPGVLGVTASTMNNIAMLPFIAQVDTDLREGNFYGKGAETSASALGNLLLASLAVYGGVKEARQIPQLVRNMRKAADVQTMVGDAAHTLGIELKYDANGKAIPVEASVIDDAVAKYREKTTKDVLDDLRTGKARSQTAVPTTPITAGDKRGIVDIFSAVSESVLRDYQTPMAMVAKRVGRASIEQRQPYMLERIIEDEGGKAFRPPPVKTQSPEDKLKEKYSDPLLEMADNIERAYKTGEPIKPTETAFEGLSEKIKITDEAKKPEAPTTETRSVDTRLAENQKASRVFKRLQEENPEALEGDLAYTTHNLKENALKAVELVETDKQKAFRIANGLEKPPEGQTATAINIALAEKALVDEQFSVYSTLVRNRSLEQTRRGQEIVAEKGSISDNSVATFVKQIIHERMKQVDKSFWKDLGKKSSERTRAKITDVIDKEVKKVTERIKSSKELDLAEAQKFLDSLICK